MHMDQGREEPGEGMDLVYQTHLLKLVKHANQTTSSYLRHSCVREEILELITYKHKVFFLTSQTPEKLIITTFSSWQKSYYYLTNGTENK